MLGGITGLTFRQDENLYAISQNTRGLYIIDTNTAVATRIGTVDLELHGGDLSFDGSGRLWLWSNIGAGAGLYEVDPATAHASTFDLHPYLNMAGLSAVGHGNNMQAGSSSDSTIPAAGAFVAPRIALFLKEEGGYRLVRVGGKFGKVTVNGQDVDSRVLRVGDVVQLCGKRYQFAQD